MALWDLCSLLLPLYALLVGALGVGTQGVPGEEIRESVVPEELAHLSELQELLQDVLCEESRDDPHGGGQAGRTHAFALDLIFIPGLTHYQGWGACEAGSLPRDQVLNVPGHGVL